ncbi:bifunctional ADP-dependent NAD(P)H-hydrate dehydratase/NAD(P)H-hydrate epimerase [Gordonia amicalis]|uniref:Bifunctional NAD(P)H-hydrate repair enzyme n=1 Tax=Gordonia amicalis TaxID=89053 RepID=A0AAE4U827_9ACTN|nr:MULTISPECIES: bifunctional ADP-dependent NAD(P)H-hydrate dehydratase/NAD(P)H-hydrate epimerase [Gordonia]ATD70246.1 bifunctional ADP-dependent NAD(P)H-hydrate dehydratase/NAD(P)H-hydrate epimerase [Gordonia sp. 1D]MBA5849123.1 bifunctional ADP-dependent NAD(P)H-hydrate dehydratase/NAD(P)H-hydrate epimerase [Gordonia amicalis]MCZ4578123.1 bifunctional ADP-dependent NAD(P)H-hydrate dehydratase/NAD(P)H-hydrate epimerase [Gordonia amicalis]MDV6310923.1 bifunctional ADP-dependent NAD(P)H-hydrate 
MSTRYLTADEVRDAERASGDLLANGTLMRRAAHGVAQAVVGELNRTGGCYGRTVGVVVGAGDNGGDALFAAAELARRGAAAHAVLLAPDKAHPAGLRAFRSAGGRVVDSLPGHPDVVIDGVVGIGGRGPLRPAAAAVFAGLGAETTVVAVDLPSGVDADTGEVHDPSVRADLTVTFGFPRRAHLLAAPRCGRVIVVDIGIGDPTEPAAQQLISYSDEEIDWPVPGPADDKYTQGVVGVVAGSHRYPGAAILASGAAVAATSGMTRYVGSAHAEVVSHFPEVIAAPDLADAGRVQAWVAGPGMGTDAAATATLRTVLDSDLPVLVDADALTIVSTDPALVDGRRAPTLLTPHAGEFARLTGTEVGADRVSAVADLAARWGVTVLLKGRITLIADPSGRVVGNDAGASWAATAGAGDVLAGIAGSLLAAGRSPQEAGAAAARVHAHAALLASRGAPIGASALLAALRPAIREFATRRAGAEPPTPSRASS